jgi:hypothetical protein
MEKIYIETSVVSYLTARPSKNLIVAARQQETMDWWETQRERFELFISEIVIDEASQGDKTAATKRLMALSGMETLPSTQEVKSLSKLLIEKGGLPAKALEDSLHISIAAVHDLDFLLTWNCKHIDNAELKPKIREICESQGYQCPEIATPTELMGGQNER